jgi:beta-fructofuranosidase
MKKLILIILLNAVLASCKKDSAGIAPFDPAAPVFAIYPAPVKGYVGDVMPFYDNSAFHLFFLADWRDNAPQYHPWYKFTTTDLLNYTDKGIMIGYGRADQEDYTLGTGSVIKAGNTFYGYYTGHNYLFLNSTRPQEGIMYASSNDLNNWTKKSDFLITPPSGYDFNNFRDPNIFFNDATQEYWMIVGARKNNLGELVYYTTKDLATPDWVFKGTFYSPAKYDMLECPDIFKWGNYWYLIFSDTNMENATHYRVATSPSGPWTVPANELLESRYFYAAKTAFDGKNRYLFGWVPTKSGSSDGGFKEFAGNMSSHLLTQNADGTLSSTVPAAIESAVAKQSSPTAAGKDASVTVSGANYQINAATGTGAAFFGKISGTCIIKGTVTFTQVPTSMGFLFGSDGTANNTFKVGFINGNLQSDIVTNGSASTDATIPYQLTAGREYAFKVVIENSIATLYVNNQAALSTRIYGMQNKAWGIYTTNGSATFKNIALYQK